MVWIGFGIALVACVGVAAVRRPSRARRKTSVGVSVGLHGPKVWWSRRL